MTAKDSKYDGSNIQLLENREAVRLRPGMYIGGTDKEGLHHLVWEIVDNSVDEAMNGYASKIEVTLHADGSTVTVKDDGRGIPISPEKKTGKPAVEIVFTKLHSGSKFSTGGAYKSSGGLHGVGAAVTNFLSETLTASVYKDEKIYQIDFEKGHLKESLREVGTYSKYSAQGTGTEITFTPDGEVFPSTTYDPKVIAERLEVKTYVNPGLTIEFKDEVNGDSYTFHHPEGIAEYLAHVIKVEQLSPIHTPSIRLEGSSENGDKVTYEVVLQWTEDTHEQCHSFVNAIPTHDGGTHEAGFRDGLAKAVRAYLDTTDLVPKRLSIKAEDIREGLRVILNVKTEGEIQFQSQNKVRLNNPEMVGLISGGVKTEMETYLFSNSATAEKIGQRIVAAAQARKASRSIKAKARSRSRNARKLTLPGKLSDCASDDATKNELFLVEGDSAGGNAKVARNREHQAILPLRGKVLNAETAKTSSVLKNKELSGIIEALGCGVGDHFNINNLRYHKVIFLMDADSDGHHISTLLLTFFFRYFPELIEAGHIYLAQPPLYKIMHGKDRHWANTEAEKEALLKKLVKKDARKKIEISRFKGLGEMMADTLRETTLDPLTRSLIQVEIPNGLEVETEQVISDLMGKDSTARQDLILSEITTLNDLDI